MMLPYSVPRRMLEIEKLNYKRHCCTAVSMAITTVAFFMYAFRQSRVLGMAKISPAMANFWVMIDFISLIGATTSLLCGLVLVFVVENRKSKLRKLIIKESRRMGFKTRIAEEQHRKDFLDKVSDAIEVSGNKVDLFASTCNFFIQLFAVSSLLVYGIRVNAHYRVGVLGLGDVVDLVSNSAYVLAVLLFTISHIIVQRNVKNRTKNVEDTSKLLAILLCGNLFVLGGKIIIVLESVGLLSNAPMPYGTGGELPVAWTIRAMGMLLCALGLYVVMKNTDRKCDELSKIVERGEDSLEVMTTISTHEVRSCFGYLEYGTR